MNSDIILFFLIVFSIGLSKILYVILFRFSKTLGSRNLKENEIRWSDKLKPSLGGIVFFVIFLFTTLLWVFIYSPSYPEYKSKIAVLLISASSAFLMGLSDDAYNTFPTIKLLVQLFCGSSMVFAGFHFHFFSIPVLNYSITVFFVVLVMNGMNLIDNMDGVAGTLSLVISINLLVYQLVFNQPLGILTFILTGNICTLMVFLFYNLHPSKIFMGDSGSQFEGFLLGGSVTVLFSNTTPRLYLPEIYYQWIMIFLIFLIPFIDVFSVFTQRILRGQSPFIGGKDHTNHALYFLGLSENKIVLLYTLIQLIACTLSVSFIFFSTLMTLTIFSLIFIFTVFFILYFISLKVHVLKKSGQN